HAYEGDGVSGTAYLQARDTSGTTTIGMQLRTQNAGAIRDTMYLSPAGQVGIGTNSPGAPLGVPSNGVLFTVTPGTLFGASSATACTLDMVGIAGTLGIWDNLRVNGSVSGVGSYQNISDARYKTNVATVENGLDAILNLRGVTFDWKKG